MERLGLFGGTFDPPHLGHLILAMVCADALRLDAVWFVPAGTPPHKRGRRITPIEHRLAMLHLALSDNPAFEVSRIDVDRPGPHYTVDMVALAHKERPDADFFFLMGGDSLRDLPIWRDAPRLIHLCRLGVYRRPEDGVDLAALEQALPGVSQRIVLVDGPSVGLSASAIGQRVRERRSIRYLVPEGVRAYIDAHRLYADPAI